MAEREGGEPFIDWQDYGDLLFFTAIAEAHRDRVRALDCFGRAVRMWDGCGFRDRVVIVGGLHETYKLALALIAARELGQTPHICDESRRTLLRLQDDAGGWVREFDAEGNPFGETCVEATALAILALDPPLAPR